MIVDLKYTKTKNIPLFKAVMVGDSEVGKTTLLNAISKKAFTNNQKSVGNDYIVKRMSTKEGKELILEIWDTAGNEKLRTMVSSYYRGAHAIIILFDYTNMNSFYSIKNWLKEIKLFAKENTIKYLVCNKIDNNNSYDNTTSNSSSWQLNEDDAENFAKQNNMKLFKISALNLSGVNELIETVAEDVYATSDVNLIDNRSQSFRLKYFNENKNENTDESNPKGNNYTRGKCC